MKKITKVQSEKMKKVRMFFTFELSHGKGLADFPRYFAGIESATDRVNVRSDAGVLLTG